MIRIVRWDAPVWAWMVVALVSLGCLGCFGFAASQTVFPAGTDILTTDNCPPPPDL